MLAFALSSTFFARFRCLPFRLYCECGRYVSSRNVKVPRLSPVVQNHFIPHPNVPFSRTRLFATAAPRSKSRRPLRIEAPRTSGQLSRKQKLNTDLDKTERLQKFLSRCGVCSRRVAEEHILDGRVSVNGKVVRELGVKVDTFGDVVRFDRKVVELVKTEPVWLVMHKPRGVITTARDEKGRQSVLDVLTKDERDLRLLPVGRLDRDSSGVLLLTNDYGWIDVLTHPRYEHAKEYVVDVAGHPPKNIIRELQGGLVLPEDARATLPMEVTYLGKGERKVRSQITPVTRLVLYMREGRNRQIRKMMEEVGHPVVRLHRVSFGGIKLVGLARGQCRRLTRKEIKHLKQLKHGSKGKATEEFSHS